MTERRQPVRSACDTERGSREETRDRERRKLIDEYEDALEIAWLFVAGLLAMIVAFLIGSLVTDGIAGAIHDAAMPPSCFTKGC